jgi:hypothetical protein
MIRTANIFGGVLSFVILPINKSAEGQNNTKQSCLQITAGLLNLPWPLSEY